MGTNQIRDFLRAVVERLKKKPRVSRLIPVRRVLEQFHSLLCRRLLFFRSMNKSEVMEGLLVVKSQLIEEAKLRAHAVPKHDVTEFVRQDGRKAGFVGKHIYQAAAQYDRVAHRERLKR